MPEIHHPQIPAIPDAHVQDMTGLPREEQAAFGEMFAESMAASTDGERAKQRGELAGLAGEMIVNDRIMRQADLDIQTAKSYDTEIKASLAEKQKQPVATLALNRIGWLYGTENLQVPLDTVHSDEAYLFGSIVNEHNVAANAFNRLSDQNLDEELTARLLHDSIPRFLQDLKSGSGNLRPMNATGNKMSNTQRDVNTTYPAFKLNVQGSNYRAIVLLPGKQDDKQVIILATMFDHQDQTKVIKSLKA